MSGGSMEYLYLKVMTAEFKENTPRRKAFRKYLNRVAVALQAVEWNDSGDGCNKEDEYLDELMGPYAVLNAAVDEAKSALADLQKAIDETIGAKRHGS